jgi:hypothetical protein
MRKIFPLLKWFWRAWPALILLIFFFTHMLLINYFHFNANATNKTIALIAQIVGGLLILYSIDSNIGIIKGENLLKIFIGYLKEFPLLKRTVVLEVQGAVHAVTSGEARLTVVRKPKSVKEKIEYLQAQIIEVKERFEELSKKLNEKVDRQSKEMRAQIQETKSLLRRIETKMEEVSIGGIKVQLFGVLLIVYGSISDYLV